MESMTAQSNELQQDTSEYSPRVSVLDIETTIVEGSPSVFKGARPVLLGMKLNRKDVSRTLILNFTDWSKRYIGPRPEDKGFFLVGHNLKFDLHHLRYTIGDDRYFQTIAHPEIVIWDTSIAAYLLSGQLHKTPSLDELCNLYNHPVKDTEVSEAFKQGKGADLVDQEKLEEYLKGDLNNTYEIFKKQLVEIEEAGMLPLALSRMRAMVALADMEWQGMKVDKDKLDGRTTLVFKDIALAESNINHLLLTYSPAILTVMSKEGLTIGEAFSGRIYPSAVFFNTPIAYDEKVIELDEEGKPILYKSGAKKGQPKRKTQGTLFQLPQSDPWINLAPELGSVLSKDGYYTLGSEVLKKISKDNRFPAALKQLAEMLLIKRALEKELNAFLLPYQKHMDNNHVIHPNYMQTVTNTGRLSCTSPNLQQASNKENVNE